jgi:putative CocE/NonD family hydrolase
MKNPVLRFVLICVPLLLTTLALQPTAQTDDVEVKAFYRKTEQLIPMRDGVKLFTAIYTPKDQSQKYPIMLNRTPYSVNPYGPNAYREALGPSEHFQKEKFIFVYQDVRGKFMSEGEWVEVRPYKPKKNGPKDVDESTDTYDTIEWLLKNVPNNNGRVGMWGISYPGFYTSMGVIDAHPALKAASPQAPIADWFIGDDFHHNGALFLPHAFDFFATLGKPRPAPTPNFPERFVHGTPDGYRFFLDLGPLANANTRYFKDEIAFWNDLMNHPNYDDYWQARNIRPHLRNIKPSVMTVGGWFDAEDLFGALETYKTIEETNPGARNTLVMGPWFHGGWARSDGDVLGSVSFGQKTSLTYREMVELPFFNCLLKDICNRELAEATVFETGSNQWRHYDSWPPKNVETRELYLSANGGLSFSAPSRESAFDEYVSDPARPVPFINKIAIGMTREYMVDDQRFAATRPDVLVYQTDVLDRDVTLAGPIKATLFVSTSGTDSDFVVKVIDVFPNSAPETMGGYQMLVRGEPMRARFRNSFSKPEAMEPGKITKIEFTLPDVNHAFLRGHRIMVQIQSSWFPLVDRNPQKFVDINRATEADFQKATQRVYHAGGNNSRLTVSVLGHR